MSTQKGAPLSQKDGIPYAEIYGLIRAASNRREPRTQENKPPRWDRPGLVAMFKRLGTVPAQYKAKQAALRVLLAATEMAQAHGAPLEEVYSDLAAFCDPRSETAVCGPTPSCPKCPARRHCAYAERRPSLKELPPSERPRERLLASGSRGLSDAELLAILLGGGSRQESALGLAQRLLATFGSLHRLAQAGTSEIEAAKGIGKARVAQLKAAFEIGRRLATEAIPAGMAVKSSQQAFRHFHERLKDLKKEVFICLLLDTKHNVIREEEISVGSLSESIVHPREVFKQAIAESAAAVVFIHNHPSGNPEPSAHDKRLTKRLRDAGDLVGIRVLDHIIIGRDCFYSFTEHEADSG